jgi:hypothetical protein
VWQDDLVTAGVTGTVGLAGIIGTFFAPTWAQRSIEFRRARRLVVEELQTIVRHLEFLSEERHVLIYQQGTNAFAFDKRLGAVSRRPCDIVI